MMSVNVPSPVVRRRDGFFHPASEDEIAALVRYARRNGRQLRVRGSAHSVRDAIYTDGHGIDVMLDRYTGVAFDNAKRRVTVQAGCHLGADPRDPTRTATWERSLLAQLERRGWALPDLGGVTHQTVSGFLMTGSCGGTVRHAFEDAVVALRIVDGTGRAYELVRGRDELFDAAVCSLGLLGVISSVTFQCELRYDIRGREDITSEAGAEYGLFADGGLEGFLRDTEYARLMWWPQEGVRRVATWQARRMQREDYDALTGPPGALRRKPYSALGDGIASPRLSALANRASQALGGAFYDGLAQVSRARRLRTLTGRHVVPRILRQFVPTGKPQHFWDSWCHGLPMDNQMSEASLPTDFTEIWVPLERAGEVMRALRDHYDRGGFDATGAYICELYAARTTRGWMHPGHGRDSLRVDLFWFRRNPGDPRRGWFVQFWRLLKPFGYRLHWGKYLPDNGDLGARHLRGQFPRWGDFLAARADLDPDGIFLTRYWREALR
jgi:D-arabinono-1,4-lactone oxidase